MGWKKRSYQELTNREKRIVDACANLSRAFAEQAEIETPADKRIVDYVIRDGLVPLRDSVNRYIKLKSNQNILTGRLSLGGRTRLLRQRRHLGMRIKEARKWVREKGQIK